MSRTGGLVDYLAYTELRGLSPATTRMRRHVLGRLLQLTRREHLLDVTAENLEYWEQEVVVGLMPESRRAYVSDSQVLLRVGIQARIPAG